ARLHTGKRGKSKSRKPDASQVRTISEEEKKKAIEAILNYRKQGMHMAMIGNMLKNEHSIPYAKAMIGKRIGEIIEEHGLQSEIPDDLADLMKRAARMMKHLQSNKKDVHNKVRLKRVESKIWRISKYYKRIGKLPKNWTYDPEKAILLIK
ncbi:MAG: 30S ribosomal protein S15, partial [Candidatus Micrarchaeaceae archaeon]